MSDTALWLIYFAPPALTVLGLSLWMRHTGEQLSAITPEVAVAGVFGLLCWPLALPLVGWSIVWDEVIHPRLPSTKRAKEEAHRRAVERYGWHEPEHEPGGCRKCDWYRTSGRMAARGIFIGPFKEDEGDL